MAVSKADQKAVRRYKENNYDRIELSVLKGKKDIIKEHAAQYQNEVGEARTVGYTPKGSVNGFINRAIDETMERDKVIAAAFTVDADAEGADAEGGAV